MPEKLIEVLFLELTKNMFDLVAKKLIFCEIFMALFRAQALLYALYCFFIFVTSLEENPIVLLFRFES